MLVAAEVGRNTAYGVVEVATIAIAMSARDGPYRLLMGPELKFWEDDLGVAPR